MGGIKVSPTRPLLVGEGRKGREREREKAHVHTRQSRPTHTSRQHAISSTTASSTPHISMTKPYDWTYSTTWPGQPGEAAPVDIHAQNMTKHEPTSWETGFVRGTDPTRDRIPIERLGPASGEPILFYDDIVLFEDELADNGTSILNVKVVRTRVPSLSCS